MEDALQHITKRHINLDDGTPFLTQTMLPVLNQGASKYLFQDNVKNLQTAQELVQIANRIVFDAAKNKSPNWSYGNIVMTVAFPPILDPNGSIHVGMGFDYKRGFMPTTSITLVLAANCKDVITSYPGRP